MPQDLENIAEPLVGGDSQCIEAGGTGSSCGQVSVGRLENFAQPIQSLFEVPHVLGGAQCDKI